MNADKSLTVAIDLTGVLEQYPELGAVLEQMCPSAEQDYRAWIDAADNDLKRDSRIRIVVRKIAEWGEAHGMLTGLSD